MVSVRRFGSDDGMSEAQGVAQQARVRVCTRRRPGGRATLTETRRWLWAPAALALACTGQQGSGAPQPSSTSTDLAALTRPAPRSQTRLNSVGQWATGHGYRARVARIVECQGKTGWRPEPRRLYLGVELEVSSDSNASLAFGHSHTRLLDSDGTQQMALMVVETTNCEPPFRYSRLAPGISMKGWLVFSIPVEARALTLTLDPRPYLKTSEVRFQIGR